MLQPNKVLSIHHKIHKKYHQAYFYAYCIGFPMTIQYTPQRQSLYGLMRELFDLPFTSLCSFKRDFISLKNTSMYCACHTYVQSAVLSGNRPWSIPPSIYCGYFNFGWRQSLWVHHLHCRNVRAENTFTIVCQCS